MCLTGVEPAATWFFRRFSDSPSKGGVSLLQPPPPVYTGLVDETPEPDVDGEHLVLSSQFRVGRVEGVSWGEQDKGGQHLADVLLLRRLNTQAGEPGGARPVQ